MPTYPGFVTVALPEELIKEIDRFIIDNKPIYASRPHVIKVALSKFFKNNGGGNETKEGNVS